MSITSVPPTTTRAWRDGDHPGERLFASVGPIELDGGDRLPDVILAYETWGELAPDGSNAILIEHALTGDSHVVGEAGPGHPTAGWWEGLIGAGAPLDSDRYFIVAANVLGGCQGSTGPSSIAADGEAWGSRFPYVTIRDQVRAEALLADRLGVDRWVAVVGGSMGGMRTLEWVASYPERVEAALVLASTGYATAEQIGWCQAQILAISNDPWFAGGDYYDAEQGPDAGLAIARRIAHVTYRSEIELHDRFGRREQGGPASTRGGRYAVESYLDHHGAKLAGRFDANSYIVLSEAMNSHDIGRGRGGLRGALAGFDGRLIVASVTSDRLYPPRLSEEIAQARPGTVLRSIVTDVGHDGFLTEPDQVAALFAELLDR